MRLATLLTGLRGRKDPPVDNAGILQIGSDVFRKCAALYKDGTLHVVKEHSAAVFAELQELRKVWKVPRVRQRVAASLVQIELLYGQQLDPGGGTDVDKLEWGAKRFLGVLNEISALGASDIKFYMRGGECDLRVRVANVELDHGDPWPVRDAAQAISWIYDERAAGDGAASQQSGTHQPFAISPGSHVPLPEGVISMRGQKEPIMNGKDMLVLRLLYSKEGNEAGSLETLGFDEDVLEVLSEERGLDNGLVIIGGSTGDGKSTTLVRQLERLYRNRDGRVGINTIEDPVEYPIEGRGVGQMLVRAAARGEARSQEFTEALRHFVRINPDVGMISEIRSVDDAKEALQFVISGHKIFTTIHVDGANNIPFRLISLGVAPAQVAEAGVISLLMRQKLVPVLCPHCARPATRAEAAHIADRLTGSIVKEGFSQAAGDYMGTGGDPPGNAGDVFDIAGEGFCPPASASDGKSAANGSQPAFSGGFPAANGSQAAFRPMMRNRAGCPACLDHRIEPLRAQLKTYGADRLHVAIDTATDAWGGLSRRRAVAEYIRVDDTYRGFVNTCDSLGAKAYWVKPKREGGMGGVPLLVRIAALVARGEVDFIDATEDERLKEISRQEQARAVGAAEEPAVVSAGKPAVGAAGKPAGDASNIVDASTDRGAGCGVGASTPARRGRAGADGERDASDDDLIATGVRFGPTVCDRPAIPAANADRHGASVDTAITPILDKEIGERDSRTTRDVTGNTITSSPREHHNLIPTANAADRASSALARCCSSWCFSTSRRSRISSISGITVSSRSTVSVR